MKERPAAKNDRSAPDSVAVVSREVVMNAVGVLMTVLETGGTTGIGVLYLIGGVFAAAGLLFLFGSVTGRIHPR